MCVIGAGVAGLATAKQLVRDEHLSIDEVIVVDDSSGVGGVWNRADRDVEQDSEGCSSSGSPVYDDLTTNLPKDLMAFSDFRYPIESDHFPPHTTVLEYLENYAERFIPKSCFRLNTSVDRVRKSSSGDCWEVACSDQEMKSTVLAARHLVVCTGHYRFPFVPSFKSSQCRDSRIRRIHSSSFKYPSEFTKYKHILVIGSRASGRDICMMLLKQNNEQDLQQTLYISIRGSDEDMSQARRAFIGPVINAGARRCGEVEFIDHDAGEVTFNTAHCDIAKCTVDLIIYATGYVYKYPFLDGDHNGVLEDGALYQHSSVKEEPLLNRVVSLADPSLKFIGTPNYS